MTEDAPVVEVGGECPDCLYSPLYEDAGEIICVGCDAHWPAPLTMEDE